MLVLGVPRSVRSDADQAAGNAALSEIRSILNHDPMVRVWGDMSPQYQRGLCVIAGLDIDYMGEPWAAVPGRDKTKILRVIGAFSRFAGEVERRLRDSAL